MMMVVTENTNKIIQYAQEEAARLSSAHIEPAHLLLAIIRLGEGTAYETLLQAGFDPAIAKEAIEQSVRGNVSAESRQLSANTERIFRIAEGISREYHAPAVGSIHMLMAILRERINKTAIYLENEWKITYARVEELFGEAHEKLEYNTPKDNDRQGNVDESNWQPQREQQKGKGSDTKALNKYGRDLT